MEFEVKSRDCTSRVGELSIGGETVTTPNILWISTPHIKPPGFASLLLTNGGTQSEKPTIQDLGNIFFPKLLDKSMDSVIPVSLLYPPSLPENIHEIAAQFNNQQGGDCCIVLHKAMDDLSQEACIYVLANSRELFLHPREFIDTLVALREKIGEGKLIYTPGLGEPSHLAMLSYCTVDLMDSFPLIWATYENKFLTNDGSHDNIPEIPCSCPACNKLCSLAFDDLLLHNYYAAYNELRNIHNAIRMRTLRELVEARATQPLAFPLLSLLDREHYVFQEKRFSVTGGKLLASSHYLDRPDVKRFRIRVKERFSKPPSARVLLLLPCSARKPYSSSRSHHVFQKAVSICGNPHLVHEVIATSPLGLVPRELELVYPAGHYDIPVTGYWTRGEQEMLTEAFTHYLSSNEYETIISHLPRDIHKIYPNDFIHTCSDHPTSPESYRNLADALKKAVSGCSPVDYSVRVKENLTCLFSYQFGPHVASSLLDECSIRGKYPFLKIFHDDIQLGMLVKERGFISLTLEGAKKVAESGTYCVEIDDFVPHGDIFATGVLGADPSVRVGDEVIVVHEGDVRAVGVSLMNGREMTQSRRGAAIKVRHYK